MILNLTNYTTWYIEVLEKQGITINSTVNRAGIISIDDNDNAISNVNYGYNRKDLVEMTSNTNGNLIIYNENGDYFNYIDTTSYTEDDCEYYFMLDTYTFNRYFINANKVETTDISGGNINVDLTSKSIFKVFLNDKEIKNYTYSINGITPTDGDEMYIKDYNNRAVIYEYTTDQTITGETLFNYYAPVKNFAYDTNDYNSGLFFDGMTEFCEFDEFNINCSETLRDVTRTYKYNERQRNVNKKTTLNLTAREDIRSIVGNNYFRFCAWSNDDQRFVVINDCLIQSGMDKRYTKTPDANTTTYTIDVVNFMEFKFSNGEAVGYGLEPYGLTPYGSFSLDVYNNNTITREDVNQ